MVLYNYRIVCLVAALPRNGRHLFLTRHITDGCQWYGHTMIGVYNSVTAVDGCLTGALKKVKADPSMVSLAFETIGRATYICTGTANALCGPSRVPYGLSGVMAFSFRFLAPTAGPVWQRGEQMSFSTLAEAGIESLQRQTRTRERRPWVSASVGKLPRNPHHQRHVFGTSHLTSSHPPSSPCLDGHVSFPWPSPPL
jgi:hypothetical protein